MASSHKAELLDEEVEALLDKISDKLECGVGQCKSQEERKSLLAGVDRQLQEVSNNLVEMGIEAKKAPLDYRTTLTVKIQRYQNELARHQQCYEREKGGRVSSRTALFGSAAEDNTFNTAIHKEIQRGTAVLERTATSIGRSTAIAVETERVGTDVLGELGTQREALTRTRDHLIHTDQEISRSRRLVRAIKNNVVYNKILLVVIILLEVVVLVAVVYWKFFMK